MKDYTIVSSFDIETLTNRVKRYIKQGRGWEPIGGIKIEHSPNSGYNYYRQTLYIP